MSWALLPLTFLAVVTTLAGVYSLLSDVWLSDRARLRERLDRESRERRPGRVRRSLLFKDPDRLLNEAGEGEAALGLRRRLALLVEQSGLKVTPRRLLEASAVAGLVPGLLAGLARASAAAGVSAGLGGAAAPLAFVYLKARARAETIRGQLADVFAAVARILRSGRTLTQALQAVADEARPPVGAEFARCHEQQNLGLPLEAALNNLAERVGLLELKIFVLGALVQQEAGGNLAELLDNLAAVVRERTRMRGRIKALTGEGRMQAAVLLALPPTLFLAMLFIKRSYVQAFLDSPLLIAGVLISQALGALWIYRIVHFDF